MDSGLPPEQGPEPALKPPTLSLVPSASFPSRALSPTAGSGFRSPHPPLMNPLFCLTKSQNAGRHPKELSSLKSLAGNLIDELAGAHCGN